MHTTPPCATTCSSRLAAAVYIYAPSANAVVLGISTLKTGPLPHTTPPPKKLPRVRQLPQTHARTNINSTTHPPGQTAEIGCPPCSARGRTDYRAAAAAAAAAAAVSAEPGMALVPCAVSAARWETWGTRSRCYEGRLLR